MNVHALHNYLPPNRRFCWSSFVLSTEGSADKWRRAAEEPELRAKCDRQESALEDRCLGRTDGKAESGIE